VAPDPAYLDAIRILARREVSEARIRQQLARRGHSPDAIDNAVSRLIQERSLDDARVATLIARTEATVRRRGKLRVVRRIQAAGIAVALAQRAADEVFRDIDADALMEASLQRRLRGSGRIDDDRQFARLYRYLVGQGFDADRVVALLRKYKTAD
jgi:regulatory protein